jgi:hypothetical protein
VLDGRRTPVDFYGIRRSDVARFFHTHVVYSGFDAALRGPFGGLRDVHTLSIVALSHDRRATYKPQAVLHFAVKPGLGLPLPPYANMLAGVNH